MLEALNSPYYTKAIRELARFWLHLPRAPGQVCPKRSEFSSSLINGTLPETFVSEWYSDEALVVVQTGTVLDRLLKRDLTGINIFDETPHELVEGERQYYRELRDKPCAGLLTRSMTSFVDRPIVYRTIQLPLLDPFGHVHYFVGAGYSMSPEQLRAEFGQTSFNDTRLIERRFFDIGAGVPAASISEPKRPSL